MKVLIVTGIFPPDIGGPATYVPVIGGELVRQGHEVMVVTLSDELSHDDRGYPFHVVRLRRGLSKLLRFILTVLTLLRWGRQADLLFVNRLSLEVLAANIFLRKPLVQKVVGDWAWERATNKGWVKESFEEFQRGKHGLKVEALKALRNLCVHRTNKIIVPSRYLARWAASSWGVPEEKITVIYNAVEPLNGIQPAEVSLQTRVKIVTVGRLVPWKQVDQIIEALARCDGVGLVIIGDGPERGHLEELVRTLDLRDRVYFAGARSKAETLSLMAACDLFVLNSTYEGFPHVVLEAMSLGLPVVATAVGGTPEVVEDEENGLLLAPATNGALSETLLQLVSSPLERQRLANGAKHTMERFRLSAMVEKTEAVLRNSAHLQGRR